MALPTCECVKGLPIGEQLAAIYCATYTLAAGDVDGPYLLKSANLSDVADADAARSNISAAESGANTDITSLGGVLNIGVGGATPTAATYPKVLARANVDQTLNVGADTVLNFNAEILDTAGAYNGTSFTVPANAAGTYAVAVTALSLSGGTDAGIPIYVTVNGSQAAGTHLFAFYSMAGQVPEFSGTGFITLAAGDVVEVRAFQGSGTAWTINNTANAQLNRFFIARLF